MVYKWCVVPQCTNTSVNSPQKLFVSVPTNPKRRKMWLQSAQREPKSIVSHSNVFMCEDHFDMKKDIINYMQYKMGFSQKILLSDKALPTKFECQKDHKRPLPDAGPSQEVCDKRQRLDINTKCLQSQSVTENQAKIPDINEPEELPKTEDNKTITHIKNEENSVQGTVPFQNKSFSTPMFHFASIKMEPCDPQTSLLEVENTVKRDEVIQDLKPDIDYCFESNNSSTAKVDSDSSVTDTNELSEEQLQCFSNTMRLIANKPLMFVGVSKEHYFLINLLHKHTNIKIKHILLCLKKIRLNSTFSQLANDFGISLPCASKIFFQNTPIIANFLRPFFVNLDVNLVKKNLPIEFRHSYHNVSCIIDCLEICIQKPFIPYYRVKTWSEYIKKNTVKYLISYTPNGLVNYVSQGYGGRTNDVTIVESCKFLDRLQKGTCILAGKGFENLELVLKEKGIKLIRPPSVIAGAELSKTDVQNKIIASLRIHIKKVTSQLREFHMLKQHSVINTDLLRVLDRVIVIACALINLQGYFID